ARAVQNVEQERLEDEGKLLESLEVETLQPLERQGIVNVVKERRVRTALHPAMELLSQRAREGVRERDQTPLWWVECIQVLHRLIQIPVVLQRELVLIG